VQEYVDFATRYDVPLLLGEAGELSDRWNTEFRTLNERFGIGWCFWTYKEPDSSTTVASIKLPQGWDEIAAVGSARDMRTVARPDEGRARIIVDAYLHAMLFRNNFINRSYLESLGLEAP